MKKLISTFICITMIMTMFSGLSVAASNNQITVELDGTKIEFDVNPEIVDGRTLVPLRKIFEEIGALVKWNDETKTVSARKSSKTVTLTIDSSDLQIDKGDTDDAGNPIVETVTLEVPAQIVSGRTLVPARAISESFGLNVNWDGDNQKVIITSDDDDDDLWKDNVGSINLTDLTFEGEGVEITDNQIKITAGGDFTIIGTLADGNITVSTKEKVKLRLNGAKITSSEGPCIYVEDADKAYITITDGTENFFVAKNSDDGAVYSKENLEIKGKGTLNIESQAGHAIKASDNLTIENGMLNLDAFGDGIHINDTFKMSGGTVNITADGDGIDSESIVNISGGKINIETNGVPIETASSAVTMTEKTAENNIRRGRMEQETADLEFEKSSKGISAEWMMAISGGEITVNSASHAIHCQDEVEITGGIFNISSKYEKGISAHGNLTISNSDTVIDITKSTEGIESKNVLTINDGVITVVSTDDALNATGGNAGTMMGMGQGGGTRENIGEMQRPENSTDANGTEISMGNRGGRRNRQSQMQGGEIPEGAEFPTNGEMPAIPEIGGFPMNGEVPQIPNAGEIPMQGERPAVADGKMPDETMTQRPQTGGNMGGGMGRNMKDCLIINGGTMELYAGDDCLDANGNLLINGGTIKATKSNGSFSGAEGIIDPDGQTKISESAELIFAAGSGNERSLSLLQNMIIVYCDSVRSAEEQITVKDSNGNVIYDYTPNGSFRSVLIASNNLKIGKTYTITLGSESHTVTLEQQATTVGTQNNQTAGRNSFMK